jgi:DNA uptake protein ComE-like DNA-binding protein
MVPFKPAEVRIIIILSVLALIGSGLMVLERQSRFTKLDLGFLSQKGPYNYHYQARELSSFDSLDSSSRAKAHLAHDISLPNKVDLNHCGYYDLEALPGIGPVLAGNIISYRDSVGSFSSLVELLKVKGIGPVKYSSVKDRIEIK